MEAHDRKETATLPEGDDTVIRRVLNGDTDAFRLIVERYQRQVLGMGLSFLRNRSDAEDFTQEVFIKAFRGLDGFQGRARFSTWLYEIAWRTGCNMKERRKEYLSLADENGAGALAGAGSGESGRANTPTPEEEAVHQAVKETVLEAVKALPERFRVCVDLYFFFGRTLREIEKITGFPVNTVKSHVLRAKKLLKERLKDLV
jgi:RNA polymerase sigma-70 factor (ECF subfamily)